MKARITNYIKNETDVKTEYLLHHCPEEEQGQTSSNTGASTAMIMLAGCSHKQASQECISLEESKHPLWSLDLCLLVEEH